MSFFCIYPTFHGAILSEEPYQKWRGFGKNIRGDDHIEGFSVEEGGRVRLKPSVGGQTYACCIVCRHVSVKWLIWILTALQGNQKKRDALRNVALFVQFKRHEKHSCRSVTFSKIAGWNSNMGGFLFFKFVQMLQNRAKHHIFKFVFSKVLSGASTKGLSVIQKRVSTKKII